MKQPGGRKLKVFRTHLGFYDLIVAAPSQKAALEVWGAGRDLFSQGFASVVTEPDLVEAALRKPGVVLRRQFGSEGEFRENAEALRAPKESPKSAAARARAKAEAAAQKHAEEAAERRAAEERDREEREEKAEQRHVAKERERQEHARTKAAQKEEAERRRREDEAAAATAKALRAELQSILRDGKERLRDIERREAALAEERKSVEDELSRRTSSIEKQLAELTANRRSAKQ